jgi:hypothetical protein
VGPVARWDVNAQWFLAAYVGSLLGMLTAVVVGIVVARALIIRAFTENRMLKMAHEKNECPVCKRPMQHDHEHDEARA